MAIKTVPTGDIPFLLNYVPYSLPLGLVPVDEIADMISYNFDVPNYVPQIDYNIGSAGEDFVNLTLKNLTTSTVLRVYLDYDTTIFSIRERDTNIVPKSNTQIIPIVLSGKSIATFIVKYNKQILNSYTDDTSLSTQIFMEVENVFDGELASKNIAESTLTREYFSQKTIVV